MDILAKSVTFHENRMWLDLSDGRTLGIPLSWFPRLLEATPEQRQGFEIGSWEIHWEAIDEDILIAGLLAGLGDQTKRGRLVNAL